MQRMRKERNCECRGCEMKSHKSHKNPRKSHKSQKATHPEKHNKHQQKTTNNIPKQKCPPFATIHSTTCGEAEFRCEWLNGYDFQYECGSKMGTPNGTLVSGNVDQTCGPPGGLILTHTHMGPHLGGDSWQEAVPY